MKMQHQGENEIGGAARRIHVLLPPLVRRGFTAWLMLRRAASSVHGTSKGTQARHVQIATDGGRGGRGRP